jgi:hypothetical protein
MVSSALLLFGTWSVKLKRRQQAAHVVTSFQKPRHVFTDYLCVGVDALGVLLGAVVPSASSDTRASICDLQTEAARD